MGPRTKAQLGDLLKNHTADLAICPERGEHLVVFTQEVMAPASHVKVILTSYVWRKDHRAEVKREALFEGPTGGCKRWRPTGFISQPALHLEVPLTGELLAERPPASLSHFCRCWLRDFCPSFVTEFCCKILRQQPLMGERSYFSSWNQLKVHRWRKTKGQETPATFSQERAWMHACLVIIQRSPFCTVQYPKCREWCHPWWVGLPASTNESRSFPRDKPTGKLGLASPLVRLSFRVIRLYQVDN